MNPDFGIGARLFAMTVVHRFLDNLMVRATDEYLVANKMDDLLAPAKG